MKYDALLLKIVILKTKFLLTNTQTIIYWIKMMSFLSKSVEWGGVNSISIHPTNLEIQPSTLNLQTKCTNAEVMSHYLAHVLYIMWSTHQICLIMFKAITSFMISILKFLIVLERLNVLTYTIQYMKWGALYTLFAILSHFYYDC